MADNSSSFVGSIPENYDRYLGPLVFEPYAKDMAARLNVPANGRVLEIASGTGIVTRQLRRSLPPSVSIVATDLNAPMLDYARTKTEDHDNIEWRTADAQALPFDDASFDVVVCQFGYMFVPDKLAAFREVHRVLKPGGTFAFSVWSALPKNPTFNMAHAVITGFFDENPPQFYQVPFSLDKPAMLRDLLLRSGFAAMHEERVEMTSSADSVTDVTRGVVHGNPIILDIQERATVSADLIFSAIEHALRDLGGDAPFTHSMSALVYVATKGTN